LKAFLAFYNATLERQEKEDPKAAARNILYGQEYSGDSYLAQVWPSVPGERTVIKKFPFQPKDHEN